MENIETALGDLTTAVQASSQTLTERTQDLGERMTNIEKAWARGEHAPGRTVSASWGETVIDATTYKNFLADGCRGRTKITVNAALTSAADSAGAMITSDRDPNGVMLPRRRMTIRALLGKGKTTSSSIEYFRETLFTNNAAPVAEGAQKPESDLAYELKIAPVRTIAHWIPASRQAIEDAPQLASLVDGSLRYGLAYREEVQMLSGDGTGQNLHGLIPQATAYQTARNNIGDRGFDVLLHAISQAEEADLPASGIILNTRDWMNMMGLKDAGGNFIGHGPFDTDPSRVWGLPVVWTNAMAQGKFLVGAFDTAATVYDRMEPEVLMSDEDRDNFIKNMFTIRAEERLALAVKRPASLIYGDIQPA